MNDSFEKLCEKHELNDETKHEFKQLFEEEIIKVFYRMSLKQNTSVKNPTTTKKSEKKDDGDTQICTAKKANGGDCTFKAKENGFCGRHNPDKTISSPSSYGSKNKLKTKKQEKHECNAVISNTKKKCSMPGTVKPDDSSFYYCKRHSEKWTEFEKEAESTLINSDHSDHSDTEQ